MALGDRGFVLGTASAGLAVVADEGSRTLMLQ